jgi:hypothetical protein
MMIRLRKNQFVFYLVILMIVLMAAFIVSRIFWSTIRIKECNKWIKN